MILMAIDLQSEILQKQPIVDKFLYQETNNETVCVGVEAVVLSEAEAQVGSTLVLYQASVLDLARLPQ